MKIELITQSLQLDIHGFGGPTANENYVDTAFALSGKMWDVIKVNKLKNKGKNIWIYENADYVFAGVELDKQTDGITYGLDEKKITLEKYAYYKYIGPYNLIKQTGQKMAEELNKQGYEVVLPYMEIYGHWTRDETKLETELFMCLA